jgi:uncharacterized protein (TIGR03437 family)
MDAAHNKIRIPQITLALLTAALLLAAPRPVLAQSLQASTASVSLSSNVGSLSVTASDGSAQQFTATVTYASGDPQWLDVTGNGSPAVSTTSLTSTTPVTLTFQQIFNPPSGAATLTLTPSNGSGAIQIAVSASGSGNPGGGNNGSTSFYASTSVVSADTSGGSSATQTITLQTNSTSGIGFSVSSPVNWLSVTPSSGTVYSSSPVNLTFLFNSSGLSTGQSSTTVTISYGSGQSLSITANYNVLQSSVLSVNPTTANWSYSAGSTVPSTNVTINTSSPTFSASVGSSTPWIVLSFPGAPSYYSPQSTLSNISTATGLTVLYNILAPIPASGTQGVVTITDQAGHTATFTVTLGYGGSTGGSVSLTPSPVTLTTPVNSTGQTTVAVSSTVSGSVSVALTSPLSNYVSYQFPSGNNISAGTALNVVLYGNATGLSATTYSGSMTVTVTSGGTSNQASVSVNFIVGSGGGNGSGTGVPVAPTALTFAADLNHTSAVTPQLITVTDSGNYSAAVSSSSPWLSLSGASGISGGAGNPSQIQVIANPTGLGVGTYTGTVTVSSATATTQVSVTLQVYNAPIIYASAAGTGSLSVVVSSGAIVGNVPQIDILTSDSSTMSVQASTTTTWLQLNQSSGTAPNNSLFQVVFLAGSLPNGVYVGSITFTSPNAADSPLTVPVVLSVTGSTASNGLTLSSQSVNLNSSVGGGIASAQIGVQTNVSTSFTASTSVSGGGTQWLSVNPSSGTAPQNITLTANPSGLSAGTYYGTVMVSAGSNTASANVIFVVSNSGGQTGGNVISSPTALTFNYTVNGSNNQTSQNLTISNQVGGTQGIPFTISVAVNGGTVNWLAANAGGSSSSVTQANVTVTISPGSLPAGSYTGTVMISPTGGNTLSIPVTMNIQGAPTVTATPSQLAFNYQVGGTTPAPGVVQVSGSASGLSFSASVSTTSGGTWLSINNTSGTTPASLSVTVSPTNLAAGNTYQGTILVQGTGGAGGANTINVTLTVTAPYPTITSVENAASFQTGPVSPGEIVSIFGTAMGPATPVGTTLTAGKVSTKIGNVQVFFNGIAAPLTYVSATQINCVVPYELAQFSSPYVEVQYLGQNSNEPTLRAAATAPAIFAVSNGAGQAAALNFDNSVNSSSHPAAAGSVVQVYMTGEGQLSPTGVTGSVTCSAGCATLSAIPVPLLPVAATVNGQPATIQFYGEAPNFVSGVMQVNVVIPPNTPSGPASLVISVGGNSSQTGVTVAIQ